MRFMEVADAAQFVTAQSPQSSWASGNQTLASRTKHGSWLKPPDRFSAAIASLSFDGLSAALLPNGRLFCGAEADSILNASRDAAKRERAATRPPPDSPRTDGLLLIHSHRQKAYEFAAHARMLELVAGLPSSAFGSSWRGRAKPPNLLDGLSLLVMNNAASRFDTNYSSHEHPVNWLRLFTLPTLRLRMLILTSVNLGYSCGEFQSLAAARFVIARFPWMIYVSGPDNLPTPHGFARIASQLTPLAQPSPPNGLMIADYFIGSKGQLSLDLFAYELPSNPQGSNFDTFWPSLFAQCLSASDTWPNMPEPLLARKVGSERVPLKILAISVPCAGLHKPCLDWVKHKATGPGYHHAVWHSHRTEHVNNWIDEQCKQWRVPRPLSEQERVTKVLVNVGCGASPYTHVRPKATIQHKEKRAERKLHVRGGGGREGGKQGTGSTGSLRDEPTSHEASIKVSHSPHSLSAHRNV